MIPASESPPKTREHDASIAAVKRQMIDAFYLASPARVVEKHPWFSVTAAASAALTATVIAHAPLSRRLATSGIMQAVKTLLPMAQAFAMQRINHSAAQAASAVAPSTDPASEI